MDVIQQLEESQSGSNENKKAFFTLDHNNEEALLTWLKAELVKIKELTRDQRQEIKNNYARYKGIQYREQLYIPRDMQQKRLRYMPQMVIPYVSDVIEEKTARLMEEKRSIAVVPVHDQEQDKVDAKIAKRFLQHIEYKEKLDDKFRALVKSSKIAGESFLFTLWDPDAGEQINKELKPVQASNKNYIIGAVYQGDVKICLESALNVFCQQEYKRWEQVEYIFLVEYEQTDKLKAKYPRSKDKIKSAQYNIYDFQKMEEVSVEGMTEKITFWHKKTQYMPDGYECCFVDGAILKKGPIPYDHGDLPCERLTDVDNENELAGEALLKKTKALASQANNLNNMIIKQQMLCAHPKWMIDAASVDEQALGNDVSIVKLKPGSRQPTLAQSNPVSPQVFEYREALKKEFYDMSKSNSVVRGEPPPGVTAFVAMQFVSESENRRLSSDVAKINTVVRNTYDKVLKICAQFYKPTDKRTMQILGENNLWEIKSYKPETLKKEFAIFLQNSSALPESKSVRTQYILDMAKTFPDLFSQEQLVEMLGFSQAAKFVDLASLAARAAEKENEMMLEGQEPPLPVPHELHIVHWKAHIQFVQDINFKLRAPPEIQRVFIDHIRATEYLMFQQAIKSSGYAQMIAQQCPQFPMYFTPPQPPPQPPIGPDGMPMPMGPQIPGGDSVPTLAPKESKLDQAMNQQSDVPMESPALQV